ncbi:hypothetical protein [Cerasicoccus maritimus]|uniref:hypothetical protein n=1 Tax=Cerasicoccus maritimus TaxID=490089 RepID=UPI00285299D3|nr:hypothetical protein [Cerasicoccus maritimus]
MNRFFNGSYPDLLKRMDDHLVRTREHFAALPEGKIESLILGGGYGRGEGGVYLGGSEPALYNDLDYFLFTTQPEDPELLSSVRELERVESLALGIDVEVTCLRPEKLQGAEQSMMFFDLVMGHFVVMGPEDYLAEWASKMSPELIEPIEATRLLWNRGSGLFFARCQLDDVDARGFIYRQHMKLSLALGDALLCMAGQHDAFCEVRGARFAQLDPPLASEEMRELHAAGVAFKQRPCNPPQDMDLNVENERLRRLWIKAFLSVESQRVGCEFRDVTAYAVWSGRLFSHEGRLRCLLLALRDRLKRGSALRPVADYPRGALMRALTLLNSSSPDMKLVRKFIPIEKTDLKAISAIYETWWSYYS